MPHMNIFKRDHQMTAPIAVQQILKCCTRLLSSLEMSLNFIEHEQANRGKATTDDEWDRNVERFRTEGPSVIGIGRSYLDKAQVDLAEIRDTIDATKGMLKNSVNNTIIDLQPDHERAIQALRYVVRTYVVSDETWDPDGETTKMVNYFLDRAS